MGDSRSHFLTLTHDTLYYSFGFVPIHFILTLRRRHLPFTTRSTPSLSQTSAFPSYPPGVIAQKALGAEEESFGQTPLMRKEENCYWLRLESVGMRFALIAIESLDELLWQGFEVEDFDLEKDIVRLACVINIASLLKPGKKSKRSKSSKRPTTDLFSTTGSWTFSFTSASVLLNKEDSWDGRQRGSFYWFLGFLSFFPPFILTYIERIRIHD